MANQYSVSLQDIIKELELELINLKTLKTFIKYFDTEFERKKFIEKLKYSKKIKPINYR